MRHDGRRSSVEALEQILDAHIGRDGYVVSLARATRAVFD